MRTGGCVCGSLFMKIYGNFHNMTAWLSGYFAKSGDGKGEIYYWGSIVNEFYIREAYGNDRNNKENNKSMGTQGC